MKCIHSWQLLEIKFLIKVWDDFQRIASLLSTPWCAGGARAQMRWDPIQESQCLNESSSPAGVVVKFYALVMPLTGVLCDNLSDSLCSCITRNHVLTQAEKPEILTSCVHMVALFVVLVFRILDVFIVERREWMGCINKRKNNRLAESELATPFQQGSPGCHCQASSRKTSYCVGVVALAIIVAVHCVQQHCQPMTSSHLDEDNLNATR